LTYNRPDKNYTTIFCVRNLLAFLLPGVAASTVARPATVGARLTTILNPVLFIALSHDTATANRT
jgi:hypothetical protein